MSENVAQSVQKVIQDLVAPDLRELKVTVAANQKQTELQISHLQKQTEQQIASLQKQVEQRFEAQDQKAEAREQNTDAQFKAVMAALGEFKAQSDFNTLPAISALSERVAVLESRHQ